MKETQMRVRLRFLADMKPNARFFCLIVVLGLSATSYSQPKDVLGWRDARWGMSEKDLLGAFPSLLKRLPKRQPFFRLHVDYVIPAFQLEGQPFTVFFQMNDRTDQLSQVLVRLDEMESRVPREELFNSLASLLVRQYGAPAGTTDERWQKPPIKSVHLSRTWTFPTTTIVLSYGWDSQINASLLAITYSPATQSRPDERRITRWTGARKASFSTYSWLKGFV